MKPWVGISLMPESDFIESALPLFEKGEVDVIEWSFDTIKSGVKEPKWLSLLLHEYSERGRLIGHGVRFSLLKGNWDRKQTNWLKRLEREVKKYNYRYITEHYGFMTSDNFHKGAPLPVPFNKATLAIGCDRLKRLQQASQLTIGLENLAFAFSVNQAKEQARFLKNMIEPVNGFLILDIHNIWCQAVNFKIDPLELIKSYPLQKVREIHVSGGSWAKVNTRKNKVRRDTHDESVPKEIFVLLKQTLLMCRHVECVIFERLGNTLEMHEEKVRFRKDFFKIKRIVESVKKNEPSPKEVFKPVLPVYTMPHKPLQSKELKRQQRFIVKTLSENPDPRIAMELLKSNKNLLQCGWSPDLWTDYMIETAMSLIKKWN